MTGTGLALQGLSVAAGDRLAIDDVHLDLPPGSLLVVSGPAGSGRSSVLATIAGARPPAAGRVLLDGLTAGPGRTDIGYAPQVVTVLPALTATENVVLPLLARGIAPDRAWAAAEQHLERLGLTVQTRHNLAGQLSGGQRQRVAVARATAGRPALLVADEPTSELDQDTAHRVFDALRDLARRGCVVVVVTSDPAFMGPGDRRLTVG